jgi:hypothetical protein
MSKQFRYRVTPDLGSVVARDQDGSTSEEESLSWAVEISKIECVSMICFPCGKEHGKTWNQSSESARLGRSNPHCSGFAETGQRTI